MIQSSFKSTLFLILYYVGVFHNISAGMYSSSDVIDLTESNFDKLVIEGDNIWIVEFYAPWCGHCQQFAPEYIKAASALKGVVKVGAVNGDEAKSLPGKYGVRGFPTVVIFSTNKYKPETYQGARTVVGLVDAAVAAIKSKVYDTLGGKGKSGGGGGSSGKKGQKEDVVTLTDSNFESTVLDSEDMWLVEFYAPWCGHCKNLEPHWAQAATELKGKVKLGALDATVNTLMSSKYGVQGYPTIKYFAPGKKDASSAQEYTGGRTGSDIVNWAIEKLSENVPAPEIKQITDGDILKESCENQPLCVVAVLPHILDCQSSCRNNYIKILTSLGDKFKKKMWGWIWSEAGAHPELEQMLEIGGFGYPAMALLNAKKMKYSILRGSFSYDGINEFLRDLSFGRGSTAPVKGAALPKIESVEPWDGKDGVLPEDEDIDLSDVDLDDLPKDEL